MIGAMARHRVQVLRAAGLPQARIAAIEGISERSVRTICDEAPLEDPRDAVQARERGVGRPSVVEPWRERLAAVLVAEPRLPTVEILHRLRGLGYAGGKSALYELACELRPKLGTPLVRFEGVAGEFSQHDFGQVEVRKDSRIQWNDTFGQTALDYRFAPELCTPRRGQEKGSAENLVGFVKNGFFKVRRFHDHADMLVQLAEWHLEVNTVRPCRATGVPPAERIAAERERLRPLAIPAAEYALRFSVFVGPTGLVTFQGYRYSMPPEAIGIPGMLWLYANRVRIVAGRFEREHARVPEQGKDSFHPEDRAARLAQVAGKRGRLYLKRQEILDLGPAAESFLTEIVHRHRFTWQGEVEQLHGALVQHGPAALHRALAVAHERELYGAPHVLRLLAKEVA